MNRFFTSADQTPVYNRLEREHVFIDLVQNTNTQRNRAAALQEFIRQEEDILSQFENPDEHSALLNHARQALALLEHKKNTSVLDALVLLANIANGKNSSGFPDVGNTFK